VYCCLSLLYFLVFLFFHAVCVNAIAAISDLGEYEEEIVRLWPSGRIGGAGGRGRIMVISLTEIFSLILIMLSDLS
jgi:hypothetical protein